jgi:hypothetical protein
VFLFLAWCTAVIPPMLNTKFLHTDRVLPNLLRSTRNFAYGIKRTQEKNGGADGI